MNDFLSKLPINLLRIALVIGTCFLSYNNLDGWGYFESLEWAEIVVDNSDMRIEF